MQGESTKDKYEEMHIVDSLGDLEYQIQIQVVVH
jgi:hypothetical protein